MARLLVFLTIVALFVSFPVAKVGAADGEPEKYTLRYALDHGQRLNYEVTHVAKTKTRIQGQEEVSQVHTVSQRYWDVKDVNEKDMTFDHVVDAVEMTQQQGDQEEIRWSSTSGDDAPVQFSKVAEQIGKTLSTISVNARGQETAREDHGGSKASLGMGSLTLALPENPIAIGESWSIPREIKTRTDDGLVKPIKIRELYTLEKVKSGVATLSIRSEPLTPIKEESVRAQVVQQLSNGTIKFDLDAGHMISKELNWDETVVGFQGPNSLMEYRARMNEELVDVPHTARHNPLGKSVLSE
ncbi:hypothetical protein [Roseiconus lacunae]|uniref:hypothetical protein n=1 Tax=Roseiconus lacunae TaxID=2605694 RepID=UPI0011F3AE7D|nr:hypothetical protein [Roseiconus lacunae]MCD0463118.1 hypothetical protein [Roseiconus lacunae]WRQ53391.1 hypothetical protein U8335_12895 [Stieleria sp. HD01]